MKTLVISLILFGACGKAKLDVRIPNTTQTVRHEIDITTALISIQEFCRENYDLTAKQDLCEERLLKIITRGKED